MFREFRHRKLYILKKNRMTPYIGRHFTLDLTIPTYSSLFCYLFRFWYKLRSWVVVSRKSNCLTFSNGHPVPCRDNSKEGSLAIIFMVHLRILYLWWGSIEIQERTFPSSSSVTRGGERYSCPNDIIQLDLTSVFTLTLPHPVLVHVCIGTCFILSRVGWKIKYKLWRLVW